MWTSADGPLPEDLPRPEHPRFGTVKKSILTLTPKPQPPSRLRVKATSTMLSMAASDDFGISSPTELFPEVAPETSIPSAGSPCTPRSCGLLERQLAELRRDVEELRDTVGELLQERGAPSLSSPVVAGAAAGGPLEPHAPDPKVKEDFPPSSPGRPGPDLKSVRDSVVDLAVRMEAKLKRMDRHTEERLNSLEAELRSTTQRQTEETEHSVNKIDVFTRQMMKWAAHDVQMVARGLVSDERELLLVIHDRDRNDTNSVRVKSDQTWNTPEGATHMAQVQKEIRLVGKAYKWESNVWDACLFVAMPGHVGFSGSFGLILGLILNTLFYVCFCNILFVVSRDDWRLSKKLLSVGDSTVAPGESFSRAHCRTSTALTMSQARFCDTCMRDWQFQDVRGVGITVIMFIGLLAWTTLEFHRAVDYFMAVRGVAQSKESVVGLHLRRYTLDTITPRRFLFAACIACLRVLRAVALLVSGAAWLVTTREVTELLLKGIALLTLSNIDTVFFFVTSNAQVRSMVQNSCPIEFNPAHRMHDTFKKRHVLVDACVMSLSTAIVVGFVLVPRMMDLRAACPP